MQIGIIVGSHRSNSQSSKIGRWIERYLSRTNAVTDTYTLDLKENPLPLWDETKWKPNSALQQLWQPYSLSLSNCDGFVIIAPEWGGMVPPGLKNFFLFCDKQELAHKPGMIVGISASRGGAYPVAELRLSSFKNTYINYLPDHVIVRDVEKFFNSDEVESGERGDIYIKKRMAYSLDIFSLSCKAMIQVREAGIIDYERYPFGM